MMECKGIREKLSAYLEGMISPEDEKLIQNHLSVCHPCKMTLEDLKKTIALLKGLEKVDPPPWFKQKVMARIRAGEKPKKNIILKLFYPLHVKIPIQVFATVLIAVAAIYIFKAVEQEVNRTPSLSSAPVVMAPEVEKTIPKKDLFLGDKGDSAPSVKEREKAATEEKKSVIAELSKSHLSELPSVPMITKEKKESSKKPSVPSALVPREKAFTEKDLSLDDKGDSAPSVEDREKEIPEGKKSLLAKAKPIEEESKVEAEKPPLSKPPSTQIVIPASPPASSFTPQTGGPLPGKPTIDQSQREYAIGPKARVAIARFENKSAKGVPEIGNGMAEMLANALFATDRFIVLERQTIGDVLMAQDFGVSGRVIKETVPSVGKLEGADLLILGTITEFELGTSDARVGKRGSIPSPGRKIGVIGRAGIKTSHVAMIIKVIDARTSRILFSEQVEGKATDIGDMARLGGGGLTGFLACHSNTPMEKAIRIVTEEAVRVIIAKTPAEYFRVSTVPKDQSTTQTSITTPSSAPPAAVPTPQPIMKISPSEPGIVYLKGPTVSLREGPGMNFKALVKGLKKEPLFQSKKIKESGYGFVLRMVRKDG